MIEFENNKMGQPPAEVDIVVEKDEGVFLALTIDDGRVDLVITKSSEIEYFFSVVEDAKKDYQRLKVDG